MRTSGMHEGKVELSTGGFHYLAVVEEVDNALELPCFCRQGYTISATYKTIITSRIRIYIFIYVT